MISYFDNASTTFRKPRAIYKAVRAYKKYGANLSRGNIQSKCKEMVETTRKNIKKKPHKILLCVISCYAKITVLGIQDQENSSVYDVFSSKDALPPPAGRSYVCVV